jgi:hypothetical protein
MATKKTERTTVKKKAPAKKTASKTVAKAAKAPKGATVSTKERHPRARVLAAHGGKAELAKALAPSLVRANEDAAQIEARLKTASNSQLLRLQRTVTTVKEKWGDREKLIAAIGTAQNKSKDKDYLAKLATYSLPKLVDLAKSAERRARA